MPKKKKQLHISDIKQLREITFSGKVLADIRHVVPRTIERASDPDDENYIGIKRIERGKYEAATSLENIIKDLIKQVNDAKNTSENSAKNRREAAQAEKEEYLTAQLKKVLLNIDEVTPLFEAILMTLKNKFPSTRKNITPHVMIAKDDKDVIKILEKRDNELLNEITTAITDIIGGLAKSAG